MDNEQYAQFHADNEISDADLFIKLLDAYLDARDLLKAAKSTGTTGGMISEDSAIMYKAMARQDIAGKHLLGHLEDRAMAADLRP